jgi:hypothetical protein
MVDADKYREREDEVTGGGAAPVTAGRPGLRSPVEGAG